ncbi:hypothetical protein DXV76_02605 [Rhodobacteraceae bacterium CCMM004]|nr:hypothetical protein DXV76_02605 [Rhodobacteraceae bacterium CCMM004]
MRRAAGIAILAAGPALAAIEEPLQVPSGQVVIFHEVIADAPGGGLTYRFRFLAPGIGGDVDFAAASPDMQHLCDVFALDRLPATGPRPTQIVISLADRPVEFGVMTPEAVQFFEIYRPDAAACIWEPF